MTPRGAGPPAVLCTDLDGTLLDRDTFLPSVEALAAARELARAGVAIVPVTSKTAAELAALDEISGLVSAAILEGGAVLAERAGVERRLGRSRRELVAVLDRLREEGWSVRGLSAMGIDEVCAVTGLASGAAELATRRLASEPFVFVGDAPGDGGRALGERAARLGAAVERGGRLWHLLGAGVDKGSGLEALLAARPELASARTTAVGDAWNDLSLLTRVDRAFLLGDTVDEDETPPGVARLAVCGPPGFVVVARRLLEELELAERGRA